MPKPFDIGLMTFEVMQRGLYHLARFFVWADDMDRVAYGFHPLLENKNFIFLGELTAQHKDFFSAHNVLLVDVMAASLSWPDRIRMGCRENRTGQRFPG